MKSFKLIFISALMILIMTNATPISHLNAQANEENKKLKYEKNSALALNYHRVRKKDPLNDFISLLSGSKEIKNYSVTDQEFKSQIQWLKAHDAKFLTLKEFIKYKEKGKFPKRSVWINFDDMDQTIYDNAFPVLKKYHIPATGFLITNHIGSTNFHNLNLLSKKQLDEMYETGLWDFESHTHDLHALKKGNKSKFLDSSQSVASKDIKKSEHYLNKNYPKNERALAYPYGLINDDKIKAMKKNGIQYGFTLQEKAVTPDADNYRIPRILVSNDAFETLIKEWDGFDEEK
ncbi:intercellular adhesin biosynthesis polysaccharide N-deacetylase [Staphylococcus epidermidis]|uniref:intercellular adhesin biosynthesis polysaccharide N-deacetylase n=1 Tax=Staphylococcus epidermidis TaxID=1282 RepID=UPI001D0CF10B|nr:intercellular adhesin biosynthesis polysaccharide N-deacetylase [Staphylococcus epidermidis]MCC2070965.1 intercellular adhesin biosynthesis polysaccharide N-deacetylase [Staphylococcus epidermidis]